MPVISRGQGARACAHMHAASSATACENKCMALLYDSPSSVQLKPYLNRRITESGVKHRRDSRIHSARIFLFICSTRPSHICRITRGRRLISVADATVLPAALISFFFFLLSFLSGQLKKNVLFSNQSRFS